MSASDAILRSLILTTVADRASEHAAPSPVPT